MNSHESRLGNHEATHLWLHHRLLHNNLRLHHLLRLHNNNWRLHHRLLLNNDYRLLFVADIRNLFIMEDRTHHKVTSGSSLEHQSNALMNGSTLGKDTEGHICVAEGFALQHILIADLDMDGLVQLIKLLDWNFHVLHLPLRVLAAVMTDS